MNRIEEINFLPDETGRKCVVPELDSFFEPEMLARNEFKYFIIRQLSDSNVPTGLYLKDVSKFRTTEQNTISKYKFQTPFTNNPLDDKLLAKIKPGDVFDLPDYTKNQKEYACFENFMNGKAELVAVFKSKSLDEIVDPIGFKIKFRKETGEQVIIVPIIQKDNRLKFTEVQQELDSKFNSIPDEDYATQYLFCDNLSCVIDKKDIKNSVSIVKTDKGMFYPYDFYVQVVDDETINNILSNKKLSVDTRTRHCKVSEIFEDTMFKINSGSFPSGTKFQFNKLFFDEACTIPLTKKHNFDSSMDYSTFYTKKEYVEIVDTFIIVKSAYKFFNVRVPLKNKNGNIACYVNDIKNEFISRYKVDLKNFNITSSSGTVGEYLTLEQINNKDYKITFSYPRTVVIDGHSLNFDFNEEGKGYCADVTSIIEEQKKENLVYHFFAEDGVHTSDWEYGVDYRYILEVIQYTKEKIFLRLAKPITNPSYVYEHFTLNNFETFINNIRKRKFRDNILTVYIKESRLSSGSHNMIYHYDLNCEIEAIFSGESRLYESDYYLHPDECSWYATKLNLPEIQKKYPKITQEYVTEVLSDVGRMSYYECVVDKENNFYYNPHETINKPDYRPFFNRRDDEFYIPEHIKNQSGMPLIFTNLEYTKRWFLALYEGGLS